MKMIEEKTVDRTGWPSGVWDSEPDKRQWVDEETDLPCLIVRNERSGILCGYVGVSEGHPWFEKPYNDCMVGEDYIEVHGGLTYSNHCIGRVCHEVEPGEPDNVWWLGFDCGHSCDMAIAPQYRFGFDPNECYKTFEYVVAECRRLAKQAKTVEQLALNGKQTDTKTEEPSSI